MRPVHAPPGTQALQRAIGLLKQFTTQNPNLSLGKLCSALSLTKTTTHRLLAALESEGLVARDRATNTYHLGAALIALGSQALLTSDLRTAARPSLEALAASSHETTTLEVLVGDQMLVLDGVAGRHLIAASLDLGTRWPIYATSTGKCWLAHAEEQAREQLLRATPTQLTSNTLTGAKELRAAMRTARQRGYAVAREELQMEYVAVAAVFRGPTDELEGSLCIGGPVSRFTPQRVRYLGALVKSAAAELTELRRRGQPKNRLQAKSS